MHNLWEFMLRSFIYKGEIMIKLVQTKLRVAITHVVISSSMANEFRQFSVSPDP
jgi:hypothetical protein